MIGEFVGKGNPFVVAYINQFDMIYLYRLLGLERANEIFNWVPIDFASMLFGRGIDPELLVDWQKGQLARWGIDVAGFRQHNALDDARLLRATYLKISAAE